MNRYEEHLLVLQRLPLQRIGRVADLVWLVFGNLRSRRVQRHANDTVGEWAVHVQCAWRFSREGVIVLGHSDLYLKADADERYDWNAGGESRFDRIAATLNESFMTGSVIVTGLSVDEVGGFSLSLTNGLCLSVFPDDSGASAYSEDYRVFQPDRDGVHIIIPSRGTA